LGSGSGGQMPEVLESLRAQTNNEQLQLTLTDLYPNKEAIDKYKTIDHVIYHEQAVDATDFTSAPAGIKTMVNCFHHMPPDAARQILTSAQENKQALLIFEMSDNKIPFLVWLILLPISLIITMLMAIVLTIFVRPMTWRQLVFTFIIPIIPICFAWDGQASMPRIYNHADMDLLLEALPKTEGYRWEKGFGEGKNGKKMGIYLLGLPS